MRISINKACEYIFSVFLLLSCNSVYLLKNSELVLFCTVVSIIAVLFTIEIRLSWIINKRVLSVWIIYLLIVSLVSIFVRNTTRYFYGRFFIAEPLFMVLYFSLSNQKKWEILQVIERTIFFLAGSSLLLWILGPITGIIEPTGGFRVLWGYDKFYESFGGLLFMERIQYKIFGGVRIIRNLSIYPEGPFSSLIFLTGLTIFVLYKERDANMLKIVVYIAAVFSTISTTGWCMSLIIVGIWFMKKISDRKYRSIVQKFVNRDLVFFILFILSIYVLSLF